MTHIRSGPRLHGRGFLVFAASAALVVSGAVGTSLSGSAQAAPPPDGTVNIVDTTASSKTRSLWSYLDETRGEGMLFGHQHDIDNGLTFTQANGTNSDIKAGTGDYPAVFGWDTLILEGLEYPGLPGNTDAQNVTAFADGLKDADRLGGISTISAHMKNFVTGKNFNDNTGRVVSHILPGGDKHDEFNAYLDLIASTAKAAVDDEGNLIPIIFRPFHENTGSWFWWGAAHATVGEYKEIFRYTVEYLRDTKDVSNFLYSFSPNGNFGGESERYLTTYPGDAWVDIMGYDFYENSNDPEDSSLWIGKAVTDLAMLSDLADEHGKIAAFTEFGRNGDRTIKPTGNKSLTFYTDLLAAIKADPKAKKMAFMLTWSNWGTDQFYIPYPAHGDVPEHEMFQDFLTFYNDPYSVFASNIPTDALTRDVDVAQAEPTLRLVSPADGVRVTSAETTVRVKATVDVPTKVWFTVEGDATEHVLTLGADGYHSAVWNIPVNDLSNKTVEITVHATYASGDPREVLASIILGEAAVLPVGVIDDFEGYGDDAALQAAVAFNNAPASTLTLGEGQSRSKGATFGYDFTARDYQGFGKVLIGGQDWSAFNRMNLWLDSDGSNQKLVLQMKAGGQTFEAYPSLASTDASEISIHFNDFRPPPWDTQNADKRVTREMLKSVTEFYVFMNKVGEPAPGAISLDNIKAVAGEGESVPGGGGTTPPTEPPVSAAGIDDFESYSDDTALQGAWDRRDNAKDLSLAPSLSGVGTKAMKFAFDFTSVTYAGIARGLTADWSAHDDISGWMQPDGSNQQVVMQFKAGDVSYEVYTSTKGTELVEFALPLTDAVPASYQKLDPARRPSAEELKSVSEFAIFLTKASDDKLTGAVVLDDLKVTKDRGPEPTPSPTATATSSPTATASSSPTATSVPTTTVTATSTVTVTSSPPSRGDVYTTPGYHNVNGRKWFTTCEPYSTTWRCTTEIWATQVTVKSGEFVQSTGWFFNNLTYLPSGRAKWASNPLGHTGSWTSTEGRQWRTECDTATTGRNGCRSYIRASVVESTKSTNGSWSYAPTQKWVFNNIVLFS